MRKTCLFVSLGLGYANLMVSFFVCFFKLNIIALYICTILFLSINLLIDI